VDLQLKGKRAVITGGSRGIGKAVARLLAAEGIDCAICARNEGPLVQSAKDLAAESGATVLLKDSNIGITYRWLSGRPYTPRRDFALSGTVNTLQASDQNSGRGPSTQSANLSYNKSLAFGNARYGISVRIQNVFNIRNCEQVFQNTGNCDTGIRDFSQRRVGNQSTASLGSSTNVDNPQNVGAGRSFFTGFTVNF